MELQDRGAVRRLSRQARVGHDVLAGVVAFGGAGPEEEATVEGWKRSAG